MGATIVNRYIKCDNCAARFQLASALTSNDLCEAARKAGWTGPMSPDAARDRCPACSALLSAPEKPKGLDWT